MGKFQVRLIAAKNLALVSQWGFTEPFCTFIVGTTKSTVASNRYTSKRMKSANPLFNQVLTFEVKDPSQDKLFIQFFDCDDNSVQHAIGEAAISLAHLRRGVEQNSWYRLINCLSGDVNLAITANDFDSAPDGSSAASLTGQALPPPSLAVLPASFNSPANGAQSNHDPHAAANMLLGPVAAPPVQQQQQQLPPPQYLQAPALYGASSQQRPQPPQQHGPPLMQPPPQGQGSAQMLAPLDPKAIQRDFPHFAKGSFGVIFTGIVKGICQGNKVVIKDMEIHNQRNVEDWKKEIAMMSRMRSPYVVEVLGYCSAGRILTIVMEYMVKGSLYDVLHVRKESLSLIQRMRMARQCALGVAHLHATGVIHRDIKSMNILCSTDYSCKLTDFGCAKLINDRTVFNTANSGTPLWMAPEVKAGQYDFSADVYSLGLVLYELFENKLPFYDTVRQTVVLPKVFQSASVVLPCVSARAASRPTAQQVVKVLDMMIRNVVHKVRRALPPDEEALIFGPAAAASNNPPPPATGLPDDLDAELQRLYSHLLVKDPVYVDNLIARAFSMSDPSPAPQPTQLNLSSSFGSNSNSGHIPIQMSFPQQPNMQPHSAPVSPAVQIHQHAPPPHGYVGPPIQYGAPPSYAMPVSAPTSPHASVGNNPHYGLQNSAPHQHMLHASGGHPVAAQPPSYAASSSSSGSTRQRDHTVDDLLDLHVDGRPLPSSSPQGPSTGTGIGSVGQLIPGLSISPTASSSSSSSPSPMPTSALSTDGSLYPMLDGSNGSRSRTPPTTSLSTRDMERLTDHLESLSMYDLREILYQNQVDDSQCFDKSDLVRLARTSLGPKILQQLGSSSSAAAASSATYPSNSSVKGLSPTEHEIARASEVFKVYADNADAINKEMAILILSELLRGRMSDKDIRTNVHSEFDRLVARDGKPRESSMALQSFLSLYSLLWQQCQIVL